jgi:hypothetical protein
MMATRNVDPETGEILDPLAGLDGDDLGEDAPAEDLAGEVPTYTETCTRCRGSGTFMTGTCFACAGRGVRTFKTSPEQRAARTKPTPESRAKYQDKKERDGERRLQQFEAVHPDEAAWMKSRADRGFNFAQDLLRGVKQYGHLTERQMAAVQRCIVQDRERDEQHAQERLQAEMRAEPVNTVNLQAVEQAFARAKGQGIKWPKLTLDGFQLKPAGANSRNAGAIYVTQGRGDEGTYLGKVLGGAFQPSRECDDATKAKVLEAMADPMASAIAYGKKFGRCAVCHRELSDPESIEAGIGPVCRERMFGGA